MRPKGVQRGEAGEDFPHRALVEGQRGEVRERGSVLGAHALIMPENNKGRRSEDRRPEPEHELRSENPEPGTVLDDVLVRDFLDALLLSATQPLDLNRRLLLQHLLPVETLHLHVLPDLVG